MKKVFLLAALICGSFFVLNSCDSDSNGSGSVDNSIKDGTKLKITYVVDSAYFTLPADAPKYHIYGTDTQLPVPEEKNLLGSLMKAKFWSDGTREDITVLGARDYTKEIRVEYKYSFDTEKCADGYVMIKGECKAKPVCAENATYNSLNNTCVPNNPDPSQALGDACTEAPSTSIIEHGIVECVGGILKLTGCADGYVMIKGECKVKPVCAENTTYNSLNNTCVPNNPEPSQALGDACTEAPSTSIVEHGIVECVSGILKLTGCEDGYVMIDGVCPEKAVCDDNRVYNAADNTCGGCQEGYVLNSNGECEAVTECTMADTPYCSLDGRVMTCVNGAWVETDCGVNQVCVAGCCVDYIP